MILAVFAVSCLTACAQNASKSEEKSEGNKVLVAYFSATGITKDAAEKIASAADADIMEIEPTKPYTDADLDWNNNQSRSSVEMNNPQARPQINPATKNTADYEVIFIGYPIWWNAAPRIINTFLESNDLTRKTVIPFATSGGSGVDASASKLKSQYPRINWRNGKLLNGTSDKEISRWIESLRL